MEGAKLSEIVAKFNLKNFTEDVDLEGKVVKVSDVNRPALQLNGYYEHFESDRVQLIGTVEHTYMELKDEAERHELFEKFLSYPLPCVIFCRDFDPDPYFLEVASKNGIPVLGTEEATSQFMAYFIYELSLMLAPSTSIHGVLVDVYGEGLLIIGESGIGKSEAALELIHRGHRLVSDDLVEIRKTNGNSLVGQSPYVTKNMMELRGIGVIDVKSLFGVECVEERQKIDFIIKLEDWKKDGDYDRLGNQESYMDILGVPVVCHDLPIRPGRNLAVICETAAVNHRQKKMGYNAADELYRRVAENMSNMNNFDQ